MEGPLASVVAGLPSTSPSRAPGAVSTLTNVSSSTAQMSNSRGGSITSVTPSNINTVQAPVPQEGSRSLPSLSLNRSPPLPPLPPTSPIVDGQQTSLQYNSSSNVPQNFAAMMIGGGDGGAGGGAIANTIEDREKSPRASIGSGIQRSSSPLPAIPRNEPSSSSSSSQPTLPMSYRYHPRHSVEHLQAGSRSGSVPPAMGTTIAGVRNDRGLGKANELGTGPAPTFSSTGTGKRVSGAASFTGSISSHASHSRRPSRVERYEPLVESARELLLSKQPRKKPGSMSTSSSLASLSLKEEGQDVRRGEKDFLSNSDRDMRGKEKVKEGELHGPGEEEIEVWREAVTNLLKVVDGMARQLATHDELAAQLKIAQSNLTLAETHSEFLEETLRRRDSRHSHPRTRSATPNGGIRPDSNASLFGLGVEGVGSSLGSSAVANSVGMGMMEGGKSFFRMPSGIRKQPPSIPVPISPSLSTGGADWPSDANYPMPDLAGDLGELPNPLQVYIASLRATNNSLTNSNSSLLNKCQELEKVKGELMQDAENLSVELFEEANKMVADERKGKAKAEEEVERLNEQVERLTTLLRNATFNQVLPSKSNYDARYPSGSLGVTEDPVEILSDMDGDSQLRQRRQEEDRSSSMDSSRTMDAFSYRQMEGQNSQQPSRQYSSPPFTKPKSPMPSFLPVSSNSSPVVTGKPTPPMGASASSLDVSPNPSIDSVTGSKKWFNFGRSASVRQAPLRSQEDTDVESGEGRAAAIQLMRSNSAMANYASGSTSHSHTSPIPVASSSTGMARIGSTASEKSTSSISSKASSFFSATFSTSNGITGPTNFDVERKGINSEHSESAKLRGDQYEALSQEELKTPISVAFPKPLNAPSPSTSSGNGGDVSLLPLPPSPLMPTSFFTTTNSSPTLSASSRSPQLGSVRKSPTLRPSNLLVYPIRPTPIGAPVTDGIRSPRSPNELRWKEKVGTLPSPVIPSVPEGVGFGLAAQRNNSITSSRKTPSPLLPTSARATSSAVLESPAPSPSLPPNAMQAEQTPSTATITTMKSPGISPKKSATAVYPVQDRQGVSSASSHSSVPKTPAPSATGYKPPPTLSIDTGTPQKSPGVAPAFSLNAARGIRPTNVPMHGLSSASSGSPQSWVHGGRPGLNRTASDFSSSPTRSEFASQRDVSRHPIGVGHETRPLFEQGHSSGSQGSHRASSSSGRPVLHTRHSSSSLSSKPLPVADGVNRQLSTSGSMSSFKSHTSGGSGRPGSRGGSRSPSEGTKASEDLDSLMASIANMTGELFGGDGEDSELLTSDGTPSNAARNHS